MKSSTMLWLVVLGPVFASMGWAAPLAYVPNQVSSSVSVIDTGLEPPAVVATFATHQPYGAAVSPDARTLYVTNGNAHRLSVFNATALPPALVCEIAIGFNPTHVAASPDGTRVAVSNTNGVSVSVFDTSQDPTLVCPEEIARLNVGPNPFGIDIDAASAFAWVALSAQRQIAVIDVVAGVEVGPRIVLASSPVDVALTPDGSYLYVTRPFAEQVDLVETSTRTVIGTFATGQQGLENVAIAPHTWQPYVTNFTSSTVTVLGTDTHIPLGPNSGPFGIASTADGGRLYVTTASSNSVKVIDTASNQVLHTVPVGLSPLLLAIASQ